MIVAPRVEYRENMFIAGMEGLKSFYSKLNFGKHDSNQTL